MAAQQFTTQELKPKDLIPRSPKRNGAILGCEQCGIPRYVPLYRVKAFRYCSASCKGTAISQRPEVRAKRANIVWPTGPEHHRWKGGRTMDVHGYVLLRINGKQVKEHRYVMEQHLGRTLDPREVIHHINGIKTDNRVENLEVTTQSAHITEHQLLKGKWAKDFDRCRGCGTTDRPHHIRGRCRPCERRTHTPEMREARRKYRRERYRKLRNSGLPSSHISV